MTKVTNRPNHSILYCIYFENKYVNVLEMNTHIFICYENERIEFMKNRTVKDLDYVYNF